MTATEGSPRFPGAGAVFARVQQLAAAGIDPRGLAVFRIGFAAVLVLSTVRFVLAGWVEELLLRPAFHFTYPGFAWVQPLPALLLYGVFVVMGVAALLLAFGLWTRSAALTFFLTFSYIELIDKATYLNHYYFVSLVAFLLVLFPCDEAWSLHARSGPAAFAPRLGSWVFRLQVSVVYLFAGLAKLNGDWLFRAEPLGTWLALRTDLHPLLGQRWLAFGMSWAGAAFDLTIPFLLSRRRSAPVAYAAVVVFHLLTWLLFPIGVFPWLMMVAATVFFPPDWPGHVWAWLGQRLPGVRRGLPPRTLVRGTASPLHPLLVLLALVHCTLQLAFPLRHLGQAGWVNWDEQGYRFAWRVMLIEKAGIVDYEVVTPQGRHYREFPRRVLTPLQYRMMSTQPDMIVDYARHLAAEYEKRGLGPVAVYARSFAALNRRPSRRLVAPDTDLSQPLAGKQWIVPFESRR